MLSPRVPAELQDHIVDLLHDERGTLKSCCLVSKSWIPRTRKQLFSDIMFRTQEQVRSWQTLFPDPSISPACFTRTLSVEYPQALKTTDAEEGDWIPTFSCVETFKVLINEMDIQEDDHKFLVPFHGFSPAIKSLAVDFFVFPPSHVFDLILSFPLLEDLFILNDDPDSILGNNIFDRQPAEIQSSSPPMFPGCLELSLACGMDYMASRLLSLPNGLRFRELDLMWRVGYDVVLTEELVGMCSSTLESLSIKDLSELEVPPGPIDLSKATKLKDMRFLSIWELSWVTSTLQTITHDHRNLQRLAIDASVVLREFENTPTSDTRDILEETTYREWLELDSLLAGLWESHSISLKVLYDQYVEMDEDEARARMETLLPEVMGKGRAALVSFLGS